jgi:prefoldin subunit 5
MFYPYYLLVGDGFVDSDYETIALEHDARIDEVFVENGDEVKCGQTLIRFDSSSFRAQLLKSLSDYTEVSAKHQSLTSSIERLKSVIDITKKYLGEVDEADKIINQLKKTGDASTDRILSEKTRQFNAYRDYLGNQAELTASTKALQELQSVFVVAKEALLNLVNSFEKGEKRASINGVVGGLSIHQGTIVSKGSSIAKVYYGKKYITVFFESSHVSIKEEDPVIVSFHSGTYEIGRVVDISHYTEELPEEIKPRYRPPGRRLLARVLIDSNILEPKDIMEISSVYKPIGMGLICSIINCKAYLLEDYKVYLKERDLKRLTNAKTHEANVQYLSKISSYLQPEKK